MSKKPLSRTKTNGNTNAKGPELPQVQKKAPLSRRRTGGSISLPDGLAPGLAEKAAKHPELAAKLIAMSGFAKTLMKKNVDGLKLEFLKLRNTKIASTQSAFMANQGKCRYKDVGCADKTRVVLKNTKCDFIHANYIKHDVMVNTFIACQGPLKVTVIDFWTMAWQENCYHIFMLCKFVEIKKQKCYPYYPVKVNQTLVAGPFSIKSVEASSDSNLNYTKLVVTRGDEQRTFEHRQWASWPDRFIPQTVEPAFKLLELARSQPKNPTIVHCSAGIGRTGTLVLLECLYRSLELGIEPIVSNVFLNIRHQRLQAVQTEDQFIYVHYAILQKIVNSGVLTHEASRTFMASYDRYMSKIGAPLPALLPEYNDTTTDRLTTKKRGSIVQKEKKEDRRQEEAKPIFKGSKEHSQGADADRRGAEHKDRTEKFVVPDRMVEKNIVTNRVVLAEAQPREVEEYTTTDRPSPPDNAPTRVLETDGNIHKPGIYFKTSTDVSDDNHQGKEEAKLSKEHVTSSTGVEKNASSSSIRESHEAKIRNLLEKKPPTLPLSPKNRSSRSTSDSAEDAGSVYLTTEMNRNSMKYMKSSKHQKPNGRR
ncbi:unnamed protein product [Bursaphelenchus okinawaensis]|uniref:Tyrosine phosphatase n=1 Tax=Bursaphelenchus okinawaensis TaxID=465554 RepID=A0A811KRE3_9BILA|nr:unnamed protein product [Bursaphelenchus okinawaensis]CAG9109635.1 unnamed protein product [Bursaphelenchus okinawaensis]